MSPMSPTTILSVGDRVIWRGGWGGDAPQEATVTGIERSERQRDKYGAPVDSIPWQDINYACVDLDNGHWAYGEQLAPVDGGGP